MFVKVEFIEENLTFMMPSDLASIKFDDVNKFIQEKIKNVNYTISFSQNHYFECLMNEEDFDRVKTNALNNDLKFFKIFVSTQINQPHEEFQQQQKFQPEEQEPIQQQIQEQKYHQENQNQKVHNNKEQLHGLRCSYCQEIIPDNIIRYECYTCKNLIFCINCEDMNIHIVHPLIKLKHFKHLDLMKERQQNIVHNLMNNFLCKFTGNEKKENQDQQQFFNGQGLKNSLFGKLFQFTKVSQKQQPLEVDQVFLRASKIAEILQSDPERLQQFIQERQELNDEQLVEEIINNPQQFNLGL